MILEEYKFIPWFTYFRSSEHKSPTLHGFRQTFDGVLPNLCYKTSSSRLFLRRSGTTPMGFLESFLVCTAMMGDSSSVMAAGWRSLKKTLEVEVAMGTPESLNRGISRREVWVSSSCAEILL
ncbi:hypothetical protein Zmor_016231 [Zophobas morio]|uniref:Uncharacterized protein n=1 Tax=Zophobas morio TaxID=2755281 RepID=A0AA38ILF4_9CUCU|nr:hypothetical protein Zmor_016231 [Zophobas morio]